VAFVSADSGKSRAGSEASRETAAANRDPGSAALQDVRVRLQRADEARAAGRLDDAVQEMLAAADLYNQRAAPVKAVAVLREAVRLLPTSGDVRVRFGETLAQLRMLEDAAREYATACSLYESEGRLGDWLDVLQRLVELDSDNLHGRVQLAEALSRAGKQTEAAAAFRQLADILHKRGELADWELVAERLLLHDPEDIALAHALALHYVQVGRHAYALPKLVLCYEAEPGDAELLELIIETLESLGQLEKAAVICRELLVTHRRTGLHEEAERTLERLYRLDPDDPEARTYMGVLEPAVEGGTVIEFEPDWAPPPASTLSAAQRRADSGGFPTGRRPGRQASAALAPAPVIVPAPIAAPLAASTGSLPGQLSKPMPMVAPDDSDQRQGPGRSVIFHAPGPGQSLGFAPIPQPSRSLGFGPGNSLGFAPTPDEEVDFGAAEGGAASKVSRTDGSANGGSANGGGSDSGGKAKAPKRASANQPAAAPARAAGSAAERFAQTTASPPPLMHRPPSGLLDPDAVTFQQPIPPLAAARASALDALAATMQDDDDDGEFGSDTADHTIVADPSMFGLDFAFGDLPIPQLTAPLPPRPASTASPAVRQAAVPTMPAASAPATTSVPSGLHPAHAATSGEQHAVVSANKRPESLPRPRLARRAGTMTDLPTTVRDMSKDLSTLDFFVERGYRDSAVALLDELEKRHPDSHQLRLYRQRIERMQRS
jgi:tetratricopeptide (TPR) repeat protein